MLELAQLSDLDAVNRISGQVAALHAVWRPDLFKGGDCSYSEEYLQEEIQGRRLFVAKLNGVVVGYVHFYFWEANGSCLVPRKIMSITDFAVEESCRGQGIGTQMMMELRALSRAFRCTDLELSVYPQNDDAVAFYQKCGFTIQKIQMQRKA